MQFTENGTEKQMPMSRLVLKMILLVVVVVGWFGLMFDIVIQCDTHTHRYGIVPIYPYSYSPYYEIDLIRRVFLLQPVDACRGRQTGRCIIDCSIVTRYSYKHR